jgi:hypothetical protein
MSSDSERIMSRPEPSAVEAALSVVPGIASSSVTVSPQGIPSILRVVLEPNADEVEVAAAAHRILRMQFGVGLDPAHIEVVEEMPPESTVPSPRLRLVDEDSTHLVLLDRELAALVSRLDAQGLGGPRFQTEVLESAVRHPAGSSSIETEPAHMGTAVPEGGGAPVALHDHGRLAIARLTVSADGLGVAATVALTRGTTEHVGTAEGASSGSAVHRTVAIATARAISSALGPAHRLDVDAVMITPIGTEQVAVVQVTWVTADGGERLTGAAEVRDDVRQAVIRATLDAVNRRLAPELDR